MGEHKHAAVLIGVAVGKVAQWRDARPPIAPGYEPRWFDGDASINPLSRPDFEWRIKPERKPDVVTFHNYHYPDTLSGRRYSSLEDAHSSAESGYLIGTIKVTITHDDDGRPQPGAVEWVK